MVVVWGLARGVGRGFESADSLLIVEERPEVLDAASIRAERVLRSVDTWQTRDLALSAGRGMQARGAARTRDSRLEARGLRPPGGMRR